MYYIVIDVACTYPNPFCHDLTFDFIVTIYLIVKMLLNEFSLVVTVLLLEDFSLFNSNTCKTEYKDFMHSINILLVQFMNHIINIAKIFIKPSNYFKFLFILKNDIIIFISELNWLSRIAISYIYGSNETSNYYLSKKQTYKPL